MVLIREVFFCKPGKVRALIDKFKAVDAVSKKAGLTSYSRLMTDISAERYWTVVMDFEAKNLGEFEDEMKKAMSHKEVGEAMKGYHELVDHGRREIYTLES
jgi:hypothetical protein